MLRKRMGNTEERKLIIVVFDRIFDTFSKYHRNHTQNTVVFGIY
jgi:hypothetical protein